METFFRSMSLFMLIIIGAFVSESYIISFMQISNARDYHNSVIAEVETSDISSVVMNNIMARANDYTVSFRNVGVYDEKRAFEVNTSYKVSLPIIGAEYQDKISGYAR